MWEGSLHRAGISAALSALALFAACTAEDTDFGAAPMNGGSAGSSPSGGKSGSSATSTGGASTSGGSSAGGDAGSPSTGGHSGSTGNHAGGEAGCAGQAGDGGAAPGGAGGESGGGATGGDGGLGGRGEAGGNGLAGSDGDGGDGAGGDGAGGADGSGFSCETSVGTPAQPVVSDLEFGQAIAKPPYLGAWQPFFDGGAATLSVLEEGADATLHALRVSGSNINFAGASIGLNDDGEHLCPHDGSAFDGFRFLYKSTHSLVAQLVTRATVPPPAGTCESACFNYHQKTLPPAGHWARGEVRYSELAQGAGVIAPLVRTELLAIRLVVSGVVTAGAGATLSAVPAFEVDIDQLEFFND